MHHRHPPRRCQGTAGGPTYPVPTPSPAFPSPLPRSWTLPSLRSARTNPRTPAHQCNSTGPPLPQQWGPGPSSFPLPAHVQRCSRSTRHAALGPSPHLSWDRLAPTAWVWGVHQAWPRTHEAPTEFGNRRRVKCPPRPASVAWGPLSYNTHVIALAAHMRTRTRTHTRIPIPISNLRPVGPVPDAPVQRAVPHETNWPVRSGIRG